jgi:hypothetical protein
MIEAFQADAAAALKDLGDLGRDLRARADRGKDLADRLGRIERAVGPRVMKRGGA